MLQYGLSKEALHTLFSNAGFLEVIEPEAATPKARRSAFNAVLGKTTKSKGKYKIQDFLESAGQVRAERHRQRPPDDRRAAPAPPSSALARAPNGGASTGAPGIISEAATAETGGPGSYGSLESNRSFRLSQDGQLTMVSVRRSNPLAERQLAAGLEADLIEEQ